jgi:hypothetical protein
MYVVAPFGAQHSLLTKLFFSLSQYVKIFCIVGLVLKTRSPLQNLLRWLLRRGSPLPIPNREVKPDCADGTAVMWESMSLPFF